MNSWFHSLRASVSRPLPINFARAKHPVHLADVVQMIRVMAQHLSQLHLPHLSDLALARHFRPNQNAPLSSPVLKPTLLTYHTSSINPIQPMKSSISLGPSEMKISRLSLTTYQGLATSLRCHHRAGMAVGCVERENCDGRRRRIEKSVLGSRVIRVQ
jgi:hypothetical protein